VLLLGACSKLEKQTQKSKEKTEMKIISEQARVFTFYEYGKDITEDDFLKNEHDDADQAFNYVNHAMTLGLLDIYQNNPELMAALVEEINNSKNKELNLYEVADRYSDVNTAMNHSFTERYGNEFTGNWQDFVAEHYVYDTPYVPFIGFMNLGNVDIENPAYVSEPLELNEEKFTQFDDDYPMWITGGEGLLFTSVNEEMGYYLSNPIVGICNGFEGDDLADKIKVPTRFEENGGDISMDEIPQGRPNPNGGPINPGQTGPAPTRKHLDEWITHVKFQINERYENWGKSEYAVVWYASRAQAIDNNYQWTLFTSAGTRSISKKVKKNEIGNMFDFYFDVFHKDYYGANNRTFGDISYMPTTLYDNFAIGFYEYDWGMFNGKKLFRIRTDISNSWKTINSPRKFFDEWYYINPDSNNGYPFNIRHPNRHTSYWNYTKGAVQLHRWNL
jgi:hypothetical protein